MLYGLIIIGSIATIIKLKINNIEKIENEETEQQRTTKLVIKGRKTIRDFKIIK